MRRSGAIVKYGADDGRSPSALWEEPEERAGYSLSDGIEPNAGVKRAARKTEIRPGPGSNMKRYGTIIEGRGFLEQYSTDAPGNKRDESELEEH